MICLWEILPDRQGNPLPHYTLAVASMDDHIKVPIQSQGDKIPLNDFHTDAFTS
jgi:hypothetical protein